MKQNLTYVLLAGILAFSSCKKDKNQDTSATSKIAPDGFTYVTSKNVKLNLTLQANNSEPLAGVVVSVYLPTNTTDVIFKGVTDKSGVLQATLNVPASTSTLVIDPAYVGLIRDAQAVISSSNSITATIGGKTGFSGDIQAQDITTTANGTALSTNRTTSATSSPTIVYPSPYTSSSQAVVNTSTYPFKLGRPVYLESTPDVIDASLLSYINASLPEGSPLTKTHPEYLSTSATPNLNVTATSDVWITFVSEGAGLVSSLGYYTYTTGNPPTSTADIDKITLIFPNASAVGSAGGLNSGDKVKLGRFSAGTSIGFVLLQNSWSTTSGVITNTVKFYSDYALNPETTTATKKHTVTLYDDVHKVFLIGFEDLNRQTESDNDFNDVVIYASSNPVSGISTNGVSTVDKAGDSDGDGVLDAQDAFPNDATRAYISYYPSASTYANIAFEDNWPLKGDYDLNDLVVNYRYTFENNASNKVVDFKGEYSIAAAGASFHNGFGVQLPIAASAVSSVTGQKAISNYITMASNGVESGQSKAVIIPFDNHEALIKNPDGSYLINTLASKDKVTSDVATVQVNLTSPVDQASLLPASFNPFLISNLRRGYEVHLPGFAPTDKATTKLFGTDDDSSVPSSSKYYISKENWPWAIQFTSTFNYPYEGVSIDKAFLHFSDWAGIGGTSYTDWYSNTAAGYRDASKIYSK
ncbi:LruC domain-containing protein [Mucilaginibacter robiniae]|uniref:LruC domain-containing protein n=1 Tax=Mucilaginibacter robiniae TaxID=2728022 RepID=A0A7L5DXQ5_9SPHI|nr:LruC domain-containing protein [Mucilaginibacter robiniae]QJD95795.1 LruC domain-containing protein [Mucilaginibacter robiniae]